MKKTFNVDTDMNYESFSKILNFESKEKSLYIYGKPGVGKTTFLKHFAKNISQIKNSFEGIEIPKFTIMFFNVNDWIKDVQKSWKYEDSLPIKINTQVDILLVDDLGSEFFHNSTIPYLLDLFEERFEFTQKNLSTSATIITSNYSILELKEKYLKNLNDKVSVERLFSRIEGIINLSVDFIGTDKRKGKIDAKNTNIS